MAIPARYIGRLGTDVYGQIVDETRIGRIQLSATQAAAAGNVHAAITGSASETVDTTTNITNPPYCRNLSITSGGTTGDVKAGDITVTGTNMAGDIITEAFTFTENQSGTVTGNKAFSTVTKISIPAQDGAAATFLVKWGDKIGLPFMFDQLPIGFASADGVIEGTAPTWTYDADEVEKNTVDLSTALAGQVIDIYIFI